MIAAVFLTGFYNGDGSCGFTSCNSIQKDFILLSPWLIYFDVKSELSWKLVNVINRAGGVDVFWKISKNIKKSNNSKLRFKRTIILNE